MLAQAAKELRGLNVRAQVRVYGLFSRSLLRGLPQSYLPRAGRRVAAHRSAIQGLGRRALCHLSSLPIQFSQRGFKCKCSLVPTELLTNLELS